jgi:arylformamidase
MKTITTITLSTFLACLTLSAQETQPPRGGGLAERFKKLDRDGDGKLTKDEIPRLFDQLDKNKDGVVTPEEAAMYRPGAPPTPTTATTPAMTPTASSAELKRTLDIRYVTMPGVEAKLHSLDVYAPKEAKGAPVLVFVHGGGWRGGDKSNRGHGENLAQRYCAEGFVLVSVNYRLTPAGQHPANIQDVAKAVAWVHGHIAEHGGDPAQMSIMGHSAGAHLASLVAADERWLKAEGKTLDILKRAVLLDTAAYDIPRFIKEFAGDRQGAGMKALYVSAFGDTEAAWRDASPQLHLALNKHTPPMLLFYTGTRMAAKTLAPAFAEALTRVGAPSRAVDTITLEHNEILSNAAVKEHPLAQLVLRFLNGEDITKFPDKLSVAAPAPASSAPKPAPKPAASVKEADNANTSSLSFTFTQDYFPGTKDAHGQFTTGTELNYLVAHDGKLFATVSCWNLDKNGPNPGPHVLVKKSATAPWEVDQVFGPDYLRAGSMKSVVFTTDRSGKKLDAPVAILIAEAARIRPPLSAGAWSRDDAKGKWTRMVVTTDTTRADGNTTMGTELRAFASHVDRVTGVYHVFAAASKGAIFRGAFDPGVPGRIAWEKAPELDGARARIHGLAEAEGVLYAAVGVIPDVTGPEGGGIFRRVDGVQPKWEFVYRWEAKSAHRRKSMPAMRGPTAIPALDGKGEVLIGAPESTGVIEVIAPGPMPLATRELDIRDYFAKSWNATGEMSASLFAYNEFTPFTHPDTGARVHLIGGWIRHPAGGELNRSSWMLVRDATGHYTHLRVWDPAHPPAEIVFGGLRGCRTICVSPFPEDKGRVIYCGGFDATGLGGDTKYRDTAWILKGALLETESSKTGAR